MNRLNTAKRVQVLSALVEGVSSNAACRMTGTAKHTALNLPRDFYRIHQTLRVTPAMEAGVANRVWSMAELVAMLDSRDLQKAA